MKRLFEDGLGAEPRGGIFCPFWRPGRPVQPAHCNCEVTINIQHHFEKSAVRITANNNIDWHWTKSGMGKSQKNMTLTLGWRVEKGILKHSEQSPQSSEALCSSTVLGKHYDKVGGVCTFLCACAWILRLANGNVFFSFLPEYGFIFLLSGIYHITVSKLYSCRQLWSTISNCYQSRHLSDDLGVRDFYLWLCKLSHQVSWSTKWH